ncbi:MAG: DUF6172 family protein [Mariprofundaceae bacterium]|nr:DUF6172 family protein [Mariprofundaceae bacterium]
MKKTFKLTHPKKTTARLVDSVRRDVKKYVKRERKKELPEGFDEWGFDCKFGASAESNKVVSVEGISKCIDDAEKAGLETFYIEILVKPVASDKSFKK